ncbi:MAG: hypothetical protein F4X54_07385 [Chloroflexi bacterium]|nr:hypothetical protein [Chloroflexota bacterium]MYB84540.1 hypothetical protein [Chloroflexota bacterium]
MMEIRLPEIQSGTHAIVELQQWLQRNYGPGWTIKEADVNKQADGTWVATISDPIQEPTP